MREKTDGSNVKSEATRKSQAREASQLLFERVEAINLDEVSPSDAGTGRPADGVEWSPGWGDRSGGI